MIRDRRSDDAMARMRAANPFSAEELGKAIGEAGLARAMGRAIAAGEAPVRPIPVGDRIAMEGAAAGGTRRVGIFVSRRRAVTVGFGLACAAVIAALLVLGGGSVDSVKDGGRPEYADAAVRVAEANPRLLITAPGWRVIHASSFEVESGAMTFGFGPHPAANRDAHSALLQWYPASLYRETMHDRRRDATVEATTVLGRRATTFRYDRTSSYTTVLPPQGGVFVEINASLAEQETVMMSLRAVSVDRWLAAMPPEVVQPAAQSEVVARMLRGVPLPPGFESSTLGTESDLTVHFELGRAVAGAVACGWIESWDSAMRAGDEATAREAVAGMAGVRHWPVLLEMVHEKGYQGSVLPAHGRGWPSYVVGAAREMAAGHLRRQPAVERRYWHGHLAGVMTPRNAAPVSVLGCHLGG